MFSSSIFNFYGLFQEVIVIVSDYAVRLAPEVSSIQLTGFEHNAVTCIGMKTEIPVKTCFLLLFTVYLMSSDSLMEPESLLFDMTVKLLAISLP